MSLLDKLMEKKDIRIWISFRIQELEMDRQKVISETKPMDRELIKERFNGRFRELQHLRTILNHNELKNDAKRMYHKTNEKFHELVNKKLLGEITQDDKRCLKTIKHECDIIENDIMDGGNVNDD